MTLYDRYSKWNGAIIEYVTQGLNTGERVFLSIDNDALELIGDTFDEPCPANGWAQDFIQSVRRQCVRGDRIDVDSLTRSNSGRPIYVAFLAFMVLAAYYMGDEDEDRPIDPTDYFTHFKKLAGLSTQQNRRAGLRPGDDEILWRNWARWLRDLGFLPTARSGEGPYRYVRYPISQTLLRQSDKNRLWRHFTQSNWRKNYDEVLLMQRIRRDAQNLTTHLQALFDPTGDMWLTSYEAISNACYELYEDWRESDGTDERRTTSGPRRRTSLDAKVYRSPEDFLTREVEYRIFPRQARQFPNAELTVDYDGTREVLVQERPGWYVPLQPPLTGPDLSTGLKLRINSTNTAISTLYFPAREFWVLTLDPDSPDSGIYASWDKGIELGAEFILLAHEELQSDMATLRERDLLEWQEMRPVFEDWWEYLYVTVQAESDMWLNLDLANERLALTLQPRTTFNIDLVGGLRVLRGKGWIVGYPPKISLASFKSDADLFLYDENDDEIFSSTVQAGDSDLTELPLTQRGNYRLVVQQQSQYDEKIIRMLCWDEIPSRIVDFDQIAQDYQLAVYGATVKD